LTFALGLRWAGRLRHAVLAPHGRHRAVHRLRVYLATVVLFYVHGRYRIPAVPFLMVFGGARGLHAVTAPRWRAVAALGAGLVAAGTITNHERCEAAYDGIPVVCLGVDSWFDSSG
jgi:hypothetical protein